MHHQVCSKTGHDHRPSCSKFAGSSTTAVFEPAGRGSLNLMSGSASTPMRAHSACMHLIARARARRTAFFGSFRVKGCTGASTCPFAFTVRKPLKPCDVGLPPLLPPTTLPPTLPLAVGLRAPFSPALKSFNHQNAPFLSWQGADHTENSLLATWSSDRLVSTRDL